MGRKIIRCLKCKNCMQFKAQIDCKRCLPCRSRKQHGGYMINRNLCRKRICMQPKYIYIHAKVEQLKLRGTSRVKRRRACRICKGCLAKDCNKCFICKMKKVGKYRNCICYKRRCQNLVSVNLAFGRRGRAGKEKQDLGKSNKNSNLKNYKTLMKKENISNRYAKFNPKRCYNCDGCYRLTKQIDCKKCVGCKDKPKYGGIGKLRHLCSTKVCINSNEVAEKDKKIAFNIQAEKGKKITSKNMAKKGKKRVFNKEPEKVKKRVFNKEAEKGEKTFMFQGKVTGRRKISTKRCNECSSCFNFYQKRPCGTCAYCVKKKRNSAYRGGHCRYWCCINPKSKMLMTKKTVVKDVESSSKAKNPHTRAEANKRKIENMKLNKVSLKNINLEVVPLKNMKLQIVPLEKMNLDYAPLKNKKLDIVPKRFSNSEKVPERLFNSEEVPESFSNSEEVPESFSNSEEVPESFSNSVESPERLLNSEEVPESFSNFERVPESFSISERVQESVPNSGGFPESFSSNSKTKMSWYESPACQNFLEKKMCKNCFHCDDKNKFESKDNEICRERICTKPKFIGFPLLSSLENMELSIEDSSSDDMETAVGVTNSYDTNTAVGDINSDDMESTVGDTNSDDMESTVGDKNSEDIEPTVEDANKVIESIVGDRNKEDIESIVEDKNKEDIESIVEDIESNDRDTNKEDNESTVGDTNIESNHPMPTSNKTCPNCKSNFAENSISHSGIKNKKIGYRGITSTNIIRSRIRRKNISRIGIKRKNISRIGIKRKNITRNGNKNKKRKASKGQLSGKPLDEDPTMREASQQVHHTPTVPVGNVNITCPELSFSERVDNTHRKESYNGEDFEKTTVHCHICGQSSSVRKKDFQMLIGPYQCQNCTQDSLIDLVKESISDQDSVVCMHSSRLIPVVSILPEHSGLTSDNDLKRRVSLFEEETFGAIHNSDESLTEKKYERSSTFKNLANESKSFWCSNSDAKLRSIFHQDPEMSEVLREFIRSKLGSSDNICLFQNQNINVGGEELFESQTVNDWMLT